MGDPSIGGNAVENGDWSRLAFALLGGAIGAAAAAAVWAAIAGSTGREAGYLAVVVGLLTGLGVKLGAGGHHARQLQIGAAALALLGLVIGRYFIFAHFFTASLAERGLEVGPFDRIVLATFGRATQDQLSALDLVWMLLGLAAAWKVPAPSKAGSGS